MFSEWLERRRRARATKAAARVSGSAQDIRGSWPGLPAPDPVGASVFPVPDVIGSVTSPAGLHIRGRTEELDSVAALSTKLVLVTGPPGVGKTRLLQVDAERCTEDPTLCAAFEPVDLEYRPGSLQSSLLGSLGMALVTHESSEPLAARWGKVFSNSLDQAADATTRDMIRGASSFMNGFVRARLGDVAGDAIETFEASWMTAVDQQLARRIEAEADLGAMRAFCALAEQVQDLVNRPVVLTLDRGERLSDLDFRMLLDLLSILPAGVHVHLGHTRAKPGDEGRIADLTAAGAVTPSALTVIDMVGLAREVVRDWMIDLNLEPDQEVAGVDEVVRVTAGYPLHVDLALRAIQRAGTLDQLSGDEALSSMIKENYRILSAEDQRVLMLLAAFSDPPETDVLLGVLGIDEELWTVRQQRLVDARFLVCQVAGKPWFHELGRRLLWDAVLSGAQRTTAAGTVVRALQDHCDSAKAMRISYCIDLARLAVLTPMTFDNDAHAKAVLSLGPAHLAVLGAIEELTDPEKPVAFIGDTVYHARRRFGPVSEDLYDAAEQLHERNLVVVSQNEENQVLGATWGSPMARFLGVGRIIVECGRTPINTIAGAVLHSVVLPHCHPFHMASLGAGYTSLVNLSRELKERQYDREGNVVTTHNRPGILLRPALGSLEFAGAITFEDETSRNQALEALTGPKAPSRVFGEPWNTEEVYPWPQAEPLPARRFAAAAELLTDTNFHHEFTVPNVPDLATVTSLHEEMDLAVRTWRTLAGLSDGLERAVLDLTRPRGIGFFSAGGGMMSADILGRDEAVDLGTLEGLSFGLAARKTLDRRLGLGPTERITRMFYRSDGEPRNRVPELVKDTHETLKAFNEAQRIGLRIDAIVDVDWLTAAILASLDRRQADAQAFLDADLLPYPAHPLGTELFILGVPPRGTTRYRDTWDCRMVMATRHVDGPNSVTLRILEDVRADDLTWEHLDREYGITVMVKGRGEGFGARMCGLDDGIADLLSHDSVSLDFEN